MNNTTESLLNKAINTTIKPSRRINPPEEDDGDTRIIIICAAVGGVILVVILLLLLLYFLKRKRPQHRPSNHGEISDVNGGEINLETGRMNAALEVSSQEIYTPPEKISDSAVVSESVKETIDEKEDLNDNIIHQVSIKLLTPWNDIYKMIDSEEYKSMKALVQNSMETMYISYDDFESATLLKFSEGSVIANVQLRFFSTAVNPLSILENAIKSGKCANLVVDQTYFKIVTPNLETKDGFTKNRESGYYGGSEDDLVASNKVSSSLRKNQLSTKSTESRDSMTSEMGSSYVSSTNISIQSGPEEEGGFNEGGGHGHGRKKTGMLPHFPRHGGKFKLDGKKPNCVVGASHVALFDFQPQDYRELKLTRGELVRVTYLDSGGWAKAVNEHNKLGWIPQNFVYPIDPKKYQDIKITSEAITSLAGLDDYIEQMGSLDDDEEEQYHVPRSIPRPARQHEDEKEDSDSSDELSKLFLTIYPFDPTEKNELKLEVGDPIDVLKTNETGWWKGRSLRTEQDGWFPSSYVKPFNPDLNLEDMIEEEKGIALSDSEVIKRASSSVASKSGAVDGYSSDNGQTRTKIPQEEEEKISAEWKIDESVHSGVVLRNKHGIPKERAVSLIIDTDTSNWKHQSPAPLTPPPRLSAHRDHGTEKTFPDPPSKPVPPKPRQKHIEKTYHHLVASGKLGSQDSLKTVSTECLTTLGRSPPKRGSAKRRNSEELTPSSIEGVIRRNNDSKINRMRPQSYQETPKTSFLYLANRYANIKPAFSLPSLVGDQVKLSPDDDRPFLDPIPRRAKSRSFQNAGSPTTTFPGRNCTSLKDLPGDIDADTDWLKLSLKNRKRIIDVSLEPDQAPITSSSSPPKISGDKPTEIVIQKKPLPPEPDKKQEEKDKKLPEELKSTAAPDTRPAVAPKPPSLNLLGPNSMMSQLLAGKPLHGARPPLIHSKPQPQVPPRSSSKNNHLIEEHQRSRQVGLHPEHFLHGSRGSAGYGRLRPHQKHFSSFESINEESEQANTPKDEVAKLPGGNDHRRSRSEPYERILQNEHANFTLPPRQKSEETPPSHLSSSTDSDSDSPIHMAYDEKVRTLTYNSRASSLQSLTSVASSVRSTASSKHEQANLRQAIMNVHGQGSNDLSYTVGAILFELRPKNKNGLCYGILDDSTQGWFPAESVEPFQPDQQF